MAQTLISFTDFSFKYRAQTQNTLFDINLSVCEGEKLLIVGSSGSGKSTLGHCINAVIPASFTGDFSGVLLVDGKNPAKAGIFSMSSSVGTVLQDSDTQFVSLTVGEDIAFALENDAISQSKMIERVNDCAKLVDMQDFLHYAPQALSGGQKQRVALAGVMGQDVKILVFDEPLANLDPATGKYAIELIDKIQKQTNTAVIIIEHRLEDVLHCPVDRIVLVDEGKLIADLKPDVMLASNLLVQYGIREPLYLAALKYAGIHITPELQSASLKTLKLENQKEKVKVWHENIDFPNVSCESETMLELKNINFSYENTLILKNLSFFVKKGEVVSIVGQNGAGKSTTSNIICGFLTPNTGTILFNGEDIAPLSIAKRAEKIGYVMQNPNQMISKTMIYDEVALGLRTRHIAESEIKTRVTQVLNTCGLRDFMNWPISALSYGQKKRVTIASVLVLEPDLLILDEPTAGQDFRHYTNIMQFIERLNKDLQLSIIMITHDMHLMLEYTTRAIVISEGSVLKDASPATILTDKKIVEQASLKMTSLYDLAQECDIKNPTQFVANFINFEQHKKRGEFNG